MCHHALSSFAVLTLLNLFCLTSSSPGGDQRHINSKTVETGGKPVHHGPPRVKRLPDIYWNTSNPIFRIDNTDHIMDVNEGSMVDYDQVNIICPIYDPRVTPNESDTEKFIIYHVNKEEFDTCRIMSAHPKMIAKCDKPFSLRYFTISFRSFSPTPGALEFHAGKDYYFISTSSKSDLHRRIDGMCRSHNMRLVFKVADKKKIELQTQSSTTNTIPLEEKSDEHQKLITNRYRNDGSDPVSKDFFTSETGDNDVFAVNDEKRAESYGRKEPKSLDYYLYQTRSQSHPNILDDDSKYTNLKRVAKTNGSVKQEASTSSGSTFLTTLSLVILANLIPLGH